MFGHFEAICRALLQPRSVAGILPILDPTDQMNTEIETRQIMETVLAPAAEHYLGQKQFSQAAI